MAEMIWTGDPEDRYLGETADGQEFTVTGLAFEDRVAEMVASGDYTMINARAELLDSQEWEPGVHTGCNLVAGTETMDTHALWKLAEARVDSEPALQPYRDIILDYDWTYMDEHLHRVATEPVADTLAWAQEIRKAEEQQAEDA